VQVFGLLFQLKSKNVVEYCRTCVLSTPFDFFSPSVIAEVITQERMDLLLNQTVLFEI